MPKVKHHEGIRRNSSAGRITQAYVTLLTVIMIVMALATMTVVGVHLVHNKREDATQMMTVLKKSFSNYKPDWDYWRDTAPINVHSTFVRVSVTHKSGDSVYFYSHNAKKFLRNNWNQWPLLKNIQYQPDHGLYYHISDRAEYQGPLSIRYEVWMSLNNVIQLFKIIMSVIIMVTIAGLFIGSWLIGLVAKRLNVPLVSLTEASKQVTRRNHAPYTDGLPVPEGPLEVHDLAVEFNKLLDSLNRQLERDHQFVSDASHELRTPLAAIRGHIELLQRHSLDHPEIVPTSLATISDESRKMQALIESLLQLSRMDQAELELSPFNLTELAATVAQRYQEQLHQNLVMTGDGNPIMAIGNPDSVEQILLALLANAGKYSPADSTITVNVRVSAGHAKVSVLDQGSGISDADKEKIFARFYRVDESRSKKIPGTGLGLAIVTRLAGLNNGTVTVRDNQPQGSIFTLSLELDQQPETTA
ncbi:HAMP domain-containing sensor histidine kinase [Lacticaseibacillus pabuli]|uniref:histidine kinase n=1 Tax=Lacticaseibacillus pabuli TaxID=3025672 RepID=A0ABY7WS19_9LACO|nr:HAMP domain-containing sensor histidine kinase [Lacticaseibacillus sp. KACC 23028]WDF82962.1 HAMP domain-containing sensor histidine kinase [Lacticaseibacillus sp. KACC 23028]